jgi:transcriptional regulator GlxA family with amidase domain
MTPAKAIERLRLEASRERIESGSEPIERVAVRSGFGDPERIRRAFIRAFGQPPWACDGRPGPILLLARRSDSSVRIGMSRTI